MPSELRFADIHRVLSHYGWRLTRVSGSHHIFTHETQERIISLPVHKGKVKPGYANRIRKDFGIDLRSKP
jgi:predicted RNA binding protein YcfA (HicA-like mRNA interferase family)